MPVDLTSETIDMIVASVRKMLIDAKALDAHVKVVITKGVRVSSNPTQDIWAEWEYDGSERILMEISKKDV